MSLFKWRYINLPYFLPLPSVICFQSVRDLLKAVFLKANTSGMQSVAIPAIGTGNLKIPAAIVAKIMYEEAEEFSRSNPTTTLTDIRIVVYDKDLPTISVSSRRYTNFVSSFFKFHRRLSSSYKFY